LITHEDLSARQEICDLLVAYATALGERDWAAYRACFTGDAHIDYTSAGGVAGSVDDAVAWLEPTFAMFDVTTAQITNVVVRLESPQRAAVRCMFHTVMRIPGAEGAQPSYIRAGGHYDDTVVASAGTWRIARRTEQLAFAQ